MSELFGTALVLFVVAGLVAAGGSRTAGSRSSGAIAAIAGGILVIVGTSAMLGGSSAVIHLGDWFGFGSSALRVDGLAGIFVALVGVMGVAVSLACAQARCGRWLAGLGATLTLCVVLSVTVDNGFLFLLAWEAMSVCIYLIASADTEREGAFDAAYLAAGLSKLGGASLLAAVGVLYARTGSFSYAEWSHATLDGSVRGVLFVLFLVGFAPKVGLIPLHAAVPASYAAAPGIGAAWVTVALCAGFYGLWRFEFQVLGALPTWCGDVALIIGAISAVTGIAYALMRRDMRTFLGYSTVEHAGIALTAFGVALLGHAAHQPELAAVGLLAATLQVVAHNLAKELAVLGISGVEEATGKRSLDLLGGISRTVPASAIAVGAASMTLAALPPLGGFVSEWFVFQALLQGFRTPTLTSQVLCALAAAALALTGGLGLLAFAKFFGFIFMGPRRSSAALASPVPRWPVGMVFLTVVVGGLGAVAPWEIRAIGSGLRGVLGFDLSGHVISSPLILGPVFGGFSVLDPTWLAVVLIGFSLAAAASAALIGWDRSARRAPVWVSGSGAEISTVQYRPSAYSNPMRVVLRAPLGFRSELIGDVDEGDERGQRLETHVIFAADRFLYRPATRAALAVSAQVRRTQSGRLSSYLVYMLVALIVAVALIPVLG